MSINLTWKEVGDVDRIKIYRSTSKIDLDNLPLPLVNLDAKEHTSYLDVTALDNVMYYYVVEGVKEPSEPGKEDGYTFISYNTKLSRVKRETGHGPTGLIKGDVENGYFGTLKDVEFFTNTELCNALNQRPWMGVANGKEALPYAHWNGPANTLPPSYDSDFSEVNWYLSQNTWDKYIFNGKVIYIPRLPVSGRLAASFYNTTSSSHEKYKWIFKNGVSWDDLFKAGAVYGNNKPVYSSAHALNINQNMRMTKDGRRYAVRLMRLTNVEDSNVTFSTNDLLTKELDGTYRDSKGYLKGSEYFSLYSNDYKDEMKLLGEKRKGNLTYRTRSVGQTQMNGSTSGIARVIPGEFMIFMEQNVQNYNTSQGQGVFYINPLTLDIVTGTTYNFSQGIRTAVSGSRYNDLTITDAINKVNHPNNQPGFWRPVLELID